MSSHYQQRAKIAYATLQDATQAAQRRFHNEHIRLTPYRCTYTRKDSIHPLLHQPHYHLTSWQPRNYGHRTHEQLNDQLGTRVVGCLLAENGRGPDKRLIVLTRRIQGAIKRARSSTDRASDYGSEG
jgi:hypothetical protein